MSDMLNNICTTSNVFDKLLTKSIVLKISYWASIDKFPFIIRTKHTSICTYLLPVDRNYMLSFEKQLKILLTLCKQSMDEQD